ncbi:hypothetical protein PGB90_006859 [Kerria lacca]
MKEATKPRKTQAAFLAGNDVEATKNSSGVQKMCELAKSRQQPERNYKRDKVNQGKIYINGNTNIVELLLNIISL